MMKKSTSRSRLKIQISLERIDLIRCFLHLNVYNDFVYRNNIIQNITYDDSFLEKKEEPNNSYNSLRTQTLHWIFEMYLNLTRRAD